MTAPAVIDQPHAPHRPGAGVGRARGHGLPAARRAAAHPVVSLLDGRADDAEVLDVALAVCLRRGSELRVVHVGGSLDAAPTPLEDAYALAYVAGALAVARLVPGINASAVCLSRHAGGGLRRELAGAELIVVSATAVDGAWDAASAVTVGRSCPVLRVREPHTTPRPLRLPYRLLLQAELSGNPSPRSGFSPDICAEEGPKSTSRRDGATSPEELDDAWHVGVACPALGADVINAWATCSAWPPRSGPDA